MASSKMAVIVGGSSRSTPSADHPCFDAIADSSRALFQTSVGSFTDVRSLLFMEESVDIATMGVK